MIGETMKLRVKNSIANELCDGFFEFAAKYPTFQQAWNACERGDWMLCLLYKKCGGPRSKSRKILILTTCMVAKLSLKHAPKKKKSTLWAIRVIEDWAHGEKVSLKDIKNIKKGIFTNKKVTNYMTLQDLHFPENLQVGDWTILLHDGAPHVVKIVKKLPKKPYQKPPDSFNVFAALTADIAAKAAIYRYGYPPIFDDSYLEDNDIREMFKLEANLVRTRHKCPHLKKD